MLWQRGRFAEAEPFLRESVEYHRARYGDDHGDTIYLVQNLAVVLEEQDRLEESLELTEAAVEAALRKAGPNSHMAHTGRGNLAFLYYKLGRLEEAESLFREVLASMRRTGEEDHAFALMGNLALVLVALDRSAEAESLAREALKHGLSFYEPEYWQVANCRGQLGLALTGLGRFAEAETELLEAHRVLLDTLGLDHERTGRIVRYLAALRAGTPPSRKPATTPRPSSGDNDG